MSTITTTADAARVLGALGGRAGTAKQDAARRQNGRLGGRPPLYRYDARRDRSFIRETADAPWRPAPITGLPRAVRIGLRRAKRRAMTRGDATS